MVAELFVGNDYRQPTSDNRWLLQENEQGNIKNFMKKTILRFLLYLAIGFLCAFLYSRFIRS